MRKQCRKSPERIDGVFKRPRHLSDSLPPAINGCFIAECQEQQYRKSLSHAGPNPLGTASRLQWPAVISPLAASSKVHFLKSYPFPALYHAPLYCEATSTLLSGTESRNFPACRIIAQMPSFTPLLLFPTCLFWKITSMLGTVC